MQLYIAVLLISMPLPIFMHMLIPSGAAMDEGAESIRYLHLHGWSMTEWDVLLSVAIGLHFLLNSGVKI